MVLSPLDPIGRRCLRIIASATKAIVGEGAIYDRLRRAAGTGERKDFETAAHSFNRLTGKERVSIGQEAELRAFEMRGREGVESALSKQAAPGAGHSGAGQSGAGQSGVGKSGGRKGAVIEPPKVLAAKLGNKSSSVKGGWFVRG